MTILQQGRMIGAKLHQKVVTRVYTIETGQFYLSGYCQHRYQMLH